MKIKYIPQLVWNLPIETNYVRTNREKSLNMERSVRRSTFLDPGNGTPELSLREMDTNKLMKCLNEYLTPTSLYKNTSGSASNLTLSDAIENYREYSITFSRAGSGYHSLRMSTDYLSNVSLITSFFTGDILRYYMANITISGTSLTRNYAKYLNFPSSGNPNQGTENSVYIHEIIGYK